MLYNNLFKNTFRYIHRSKYIPLNELISYTYNNNIQNFNTISNDDIQIINNLEKKYPIPSGYMENFRNIGISAHIDSGKTTLTERILFYTNRIQQIHEVRGKDGTGAKMDSMDLEREKGITIASAATHCEWKNAHFNIIDTPGHVDFTIEVERALRILDGAIMLLCAVGGVQSQSITVDRQMKRYNIPRIIFINKLDRAGANPTKVIQAARDELKLNVIPLQIPIGLENDHEGVIDIIEKCAYKFSESSSGQEVITEDIPSEFLDEVEKKYQDMLEILSEHDDEIAELYLMEEDIPKELIYEKLREQTINLNIVPLLMGSAYKNKGVQPLLDSVIKYLPNPREIINHGLDLDNNEQKIPLICSPNAPLLALAFKLEESKFGQLTYMKIYQGKLSRGSNIMNIKNNKKIKVPRLVRMHSNEMEEVKEATAGDVVAMFGVDCSSMDSFTDGTLNYALTSMFVPEPVISLSVKPKKSDMIENFGKAIQRFTREDPTFRVTYDEKNRETILSGMGELHLEIYIERMNREYNVELDVGNPKVNFMETIRKRCDFEYLHRKQSGGQGQYAKVIGYIEPLNDDELVQGKGFEFVNKIIGLNIPPEYIPSCEKGALEATEKGALIGKPITGLRVVLTDGQHHPVDSSDLAFRVAMVNAVRNAQLNSRPIVKEPTMDLEVTAPAEFQGTIISGLNRRMGMISSSDLSDDGSIITIKGLVPLSQMFGYSTDLRSSTQGKGEFSMEYHSHQNVNKEVQDDLIQKYKKELEDRQK